MSDIEARLDNHIRYCQEQFGRGEAQFDTLQIQQSETLAQLRQLTTAVNDHASATSEVVTAYKNVQGAVKVGMALQNVCIWLLKWGAIGAAIAGGIHWLLEQRPPGAP